MLRRLVILAALAFIGIFVILLTQGPDETTKSDVLDFQSGTFVKAQRNSDPVDRLPPRRVQPAAP